jgi:hypothetical protein
VSFIGYWVADIGIQYYEFVKKREFRIGSNLQMFNEQFDP